MANTSVTGGLVLRQPGNDPQPLEHCVALSSYATALFIGDAVKRVTGSKRVGEFVCPAVESAGTGGAIYGVIVGFLPHISAGTSQMNFTQRHGSASTERVILVRRSSPEDVYSIMDDGTLASGARSALGAGNIGLNANLIVSTAGDSTTGMSNHQLKGDTANTTATLQLKIIGVDPQAGNDETATAARWLVRINNADTGTGTGTAGV